MTGPGPGKIEIPCDKVVIRKESQYYTLKPVVYVHIKGYSFARVTHIDIEHSNIERLVGLQHREIVPAFIERYGDLVVVVKSARKRVTILVYSSLLARLLPERYRGTGVLGGKLDGVFIGVRREVIERLEAFGTQHGWPPRGRKLG